MAATITVLDREIAREERRVGLPTNRPLTGAAISRRRKQIAAVTLACAIVAVATAFMANGVLRGLAIALAVAFGGYAIEKDRHLRRLGALRGDADRISLAVAGELLHSGALVGDRELLDLRDEIGRAAGRLAAGLADVVRADTTRVRLVGPSGEVPVAGERELADRELVPDDAHAARESVRGHKAVRSVTDDGRGVLVVPLWRGHDVIALLEAVAPLGDHYSAADATRAEAYSRGAVAAMQTY